jgi:hypothetical protein
VTEEHETIASPLDGPIRYIEEFRRLPLRRRREALPGCVLVYRGIGGRLSCPPGGLTAGELWWSGPRLVYDVDIDRHKFEYRLELPGDGTGAGWMVTVSGHWRVLDPVQVVAHRVFEVDAVLRPRLREVLAEAASVPGRSGAALAESAHRATSSGLRLAEGLDLSGIEVSVSPITVVGADL